MQTNIVVMGANGRMGAAIISLVLADPGLNLSGVVERPGSEDGLERYGVPVATSLEALNPEAGGCVVVDFTAPEATVNTAQAAARLKVPVVMGTTGLTSAQVETLENAARETPLFWAPNMSVGINVLLRILPELVNMLGPDYDVEMVETHHKMKKDAPSGTALKLAQCLTKAKGWTMEQVNYHREGIIGERPQEELGVQTLRGGDVVGDHTVFFFGPGERIEVTHRAHSRNTFAQGALRAAKWLAGQTPGKLYSMADML
ncbi:MAG: 4-hydroxy-tetrahydrodipicolinate reductase [Desulfovibrionales bacterium]|nr:4-hydroxy-tetrahydrodipicolinate reductase [Desulfovibrionales bacterium]